MGFLRGKKSDDELDALRQQLRIGWLAMGLPEMNAEGAKNMRSHIMAAAYKLSESDRASEANAVLEDAKRPGTESKEVAWNYLLTTVIEHL